MNALVSLARSEAPWLKPEEKLLIGKDILELLSSSMYVDAITMYREYVQNAVDAIDSAKTAGILHQRGRVDIRIDRNSRTVYIRDNGSGLAKQDFARQLTAFGGSRKRGTRARGFRGVGRLAGLAYCQELTFRSRATDENSVHELRWDSRAVRSALRSGKAQELHEIVQNSVDAREVSAAGWPEHFFEVELRGVSRHGNDYLLEESQVAAYLAQVAPVPFRDDFTFGKEIADFLRSYGVDSDVDIAIDAFGRVYRPHRSCLPMGKSSSTTFRELVTTCVPGREGGIAAITWMLHHDYLGAIPPMNLVAGWRFRSGGIQVGGNNLLEGLFPETRFNSWTVAETHVLDARIIPNGRRDHFEQNAHFFDLLNNLAPVARDVAQRCRTSSAARNLVKYLVTRCTEFEQKVSALKQPLLPDEHRVRLAAELEDEIQSLRRCVGKPVLDSETRSQYSCRLNQLQKKLLRFSKLNIDSKVTGVPPALGKILKEICPAIYANSTDVKVAQKLMAAIVAQLRKKREFNLKGRLKRPKKSR